MKRNVFAYTPPGPPYPVPFVSLNDEDGKLKLTVRGADQAVGEIELPDREVVKLKQALFDWIIGR